ncbi:MAG: hemagglutinin repeat-containing protein, partial [Candidatus Margulisiibacteriota bacterium]
VVDLGLNSTVFVDGELTILGSQVNGGDLALIAQKGINILGAHEKKTIDLELGYSYVFSNSNSVGHESELAVVGSNLTTQGTLRMDTEFGDITIVGSQLNVSSNLGINSENNIFILNDFDIKDRTSDKLKMGFFDYIDLSFANQRVQKNDVSKTVVGSDIFVDGNMVIGAGGRFHKTGGDLLVVGDSYIQSGASYFIAAKDSRRFSEIKELATFKGAAADFDFFRLSAGVSMHDQIFESNRVSESETVVEGRNLFGGNLTILADQNIEVRGERLITNEDIHLKANHIGVYSSQATEVSNESHLILDRRIRFGIGNAWADTAHQVVDTYEAFQDAYNQLDDTYESKLNFGSASLKLMQSTAQGAKLAQNVARSASTAGTFGFYGSVSEKGQGEYHQISSSETVNHAGGLISRFGNVNLSGSEMDLIGSHLIAEDGGVNLNINKIRVSSSQDFRNHMTVSKSISYQRELASTALITALPSLSTQHSESHVASSQNLNSQIWGNDIQVYSDEFRLNGGNLIGNQIQIDTDSLIVESNMDMYESRHNSRGISFGGTSGVSDYNHKIKSDWVGSISGIESKAGGRIKTNELNLIGGYILNSNDDDSKRLIIDSEHIFSNHLEGMTKNSSHGFSINISFSDDSQMGVDKINFGYSGLKTTYHQQIYSTIDNADNSFFNSRVHLKKSINQDFINMEKISHQINSAPLKIDLLVPSRFISCTECTDVF